MRRLICACIVFALALAAAPTMASPPASTPESTPRASPSHAPPASTSPFDKTWALAGYVATWQGSYASAGLGGRLRFEPIDWLGLDLFAEAHLVDWPGTIRHDYPIGFNLYVPFALTDWLRVRPMIGLCAVFSFIEPANAHAPGADDVIFGAHAGGGIEVALAEWASVFLDGQAVGWFGHDRAVLQWTGHVEEELGITMGAQGSLGLQIHL